ncbi:hypothetical protein GP486_003495 [Trichoglossum hirsutum]|uniref:PNPLA domain-containing protein n=1 Tax=Trichoglossum hirsutum TaxID=265104 RepID=A0A9P8RQL4_9PEZI|nr:hypothetical protein GP486_003495 [Trichoglossum hirsutum]
MVIGKPPIAFVDGGLGNNNPILSLIDEARHLWPKRDIGCIVSVGTGIPASRDIGRTIMPLFDSLKAMVVDSEKTADEFREDMKSKHGVNQKVYFRLNVQHGLEQIGLEEWKEAGRIKVATEAYTKREWSQIDECASQLYRPTGSLQEFEWYHQEGYRAYKAENYRQACRLFEHALAGREQLLGSDVRETAETRKYYAQSLFMAGQPKQAVKQFISLVGFLERTYGSYHAETLSRRMSLGEALEKCGDSDQPAASEQFRLVAVGWECTVGPDTEKAIYCRYRAGLGYSKGEPYSNTWPYWNEAEQNLQRAAEGWKRLRGAHDDKALEALVAYASVLLKKQDDIKALQAFKNALAVAKAKGLSKKHAQVREIQKGIDDCKFWLREGQPSERLEIARRRAAKSNQAIQWKEVTGHW